MLNKDKNLKLYYSISEVAQMLGVNESLLRYWSLKLIYHLVKERGMTLQGARQRLKDNREGTLRNFEAVERLKTIREELVSMRDALGAFTYDDVEALRQNIEAAQEKTSADPEESAPLTNN